MIPGACVGYHQSAAVHTAAASEGCCVSVAEWGRHVAWPGWRLLISASTRMTKPFYGVSCGPFVDVYSGGVLAAGNGFTSRPVDDDR